MALEWVRENPPSWDDGKARIIGGAPEGAFAPAERRAGELLPGEWWRVTDGDATVGYGWMDVVWGDAEILLAVDADARGRGVGSFILERLDAEAAARGLNYMYNTVRATHPEGDRVSAWLQKRGFEGRAEDDRLTRRVRARRA